MEGESYRAEGTGGTLIERFGGGHRQGRVLESGYIVRDVPTDSTGMRDSGGRVTRREGLYDCGSPPLVGSRGRTGHVSSRNTTYSPSPCSLPPLSQVLLRPTRPSSLTPSLYGLSICLLQHAFSTKKNKKKALLGECVETNIKKRSTILVCRINNYIQRT